MYKVKRQIGRHDALKQIYGQTAIAVCLRLGIVRRMKAPIHILITGASSGIGAALALEYAAPGICLSLHGRNGERLKKVAARTQSKGAETHIHDGDVTDKSDMEAWISARYAEKPIDLIIANAGISGGTAHGTEGAEQVAALFAVNAGGVFNTVHPALSFMKQRGKGQIAIMSSLAGFRGFSGAPAYCASKAAVRIYGEGLRGEMAHYGVNVAVICPGFVCTPMTGINGFPMPWIMKPERAAQLIRKGLATGKGRIAFPWRLYMIVRLIAALPQWAVDAFAASMPGKHPLAALEQQAEAPTRADHPKVCTFLSNPPDDFP